MPSHDSGWTTPRSGWATPEPSGYQTPGTRRELIQAALEREVASRRKAIQGIDAMWLLLEAFTDFNPVCASTYTFKDGDNLTRDKLLATFAEQSEKFPKYKMRLSNYGRRLHGSYFEDDPKFDLENHVTVVELPGKAGRDELDALMGKFLARSWDWERPLWDVILVPNYRGENNTKGAMVTRGHHTLSDGQGFVTSQLYITSFRDDLIKMMSGYREQLNSARRGAGRPSSVNKQLKALDPLYDNKNTRPLGQALMFLMYWTFAFFGFFSGIYYTCYHLFHLTVLTSLTWWRTTPLTQDYPGPRVETREYSSSRRFPISEVKEIQKAFSTRKHHVTLNDVLVASVTDVLAELLEEKPKSDLQATLDRFLPNRIGLFIPISIRSVGDMSMRNLATGALAQIPFQHYKDPKHAHFKELQQHIMEAKEELDLLKKSFLPSILFHITQPTGQAPGLLFPFLIAPTFLEAPIRAITLWIVQRVLTGFHAILTNVPGPAKDNITLAGAEVVRWTALPPQAEKGTIGIGVQSYAGSVCISVAADEVPGSKGTARSICDRFEERFKLYLERAREKNQQKVGHSKQK